MHFNAHLHLRLHASLQGNYIRPAFNSPFRLVAQIAKICYWIKTNTAKLLIDARYWQSVLVVDEFNSVIALKSICPQLSCFSKTQDMRTESLELETQKPIIAGWMSPIGCWLKTAERGVFVPRRALTEGQYRCLCRMLIWHLPSG